MARFAGSSSFPRRYTSPEWLQRTARSISANGALYLGATDHTLTALDANSGETRWQVTLAAAGEAALAADGLLVVSGYDYLDAAKPGWPSGRLEVRSSSDGALKWAYQTTNPLASAKAAALSSGTLYVLSDDSLHTTLFALDASSGAEQWHADPGNNTYNFLTGG